MTSTNSPAETTTLSAFDSEDSTETETKQESAIEKTLRRYSGADTVDVDFEDVTLPGGAQQWADEVSVLFDDIAVVKPSDGMTPIDRTIEPSMVGYVVGGLPSYIDSFADETLEIPTDDDVVEADEVQYCGYASTTSMDWGYGYTSSRLYEGAHIATGGNRLWETTAIACGDKPAIFSHRGHCYALSPVTLPEPETSYITRSVKGYYGQREFHFEDETNEDVIEGFRHVHHLLDWRYDISLTSFDHRDSEDLYFDTTSGKKLKFSGFELQQVTDYSDPPALEDSMTLDDGGATSVDVEIPGEATVYDVGDIPQGREKSTIVGYRTRVKRARDSTDDRKWKRKTVHLQPMYLTVRNPSGGPIRAGLKGSSNWEKIVTVDFRDQQDTPTYHVDRDTSQPKITS